MPKYQEITFKIFNILKHIYLFDINYMNILITGAGYIGSHIALNLIEQKKNLFLIDNLENSTIYNINILRKFYKKKLIFKTRC